MDVFQPLLHRLYNSRPLWEQHHTAGASQCHERFCWCASLPHTHTLHMAETQSFPDEAYEGIYFGLYHTSDSVGTVDQPIRTVFVEALPTCDTTTSGSCTPVRPHVAWTFIEAIGQTDLQIVGNTSTKTLIDMQTLYNLLEVFYHAVRIDLGRWSPDNVTLSYSSSSSSSLPNQLGRSLPTRPHSTPP